MSQGIHSLTLAEAIHRGWLTACLRRVPKSYSSHSQVNHGYQLLDGQWTHHRDFYRLTRRGGGREVPLNLRADGRLVLFCQLWLEGLKQSALDLLEDEVQIKRQKIEEICATKVRGQHPRRLVYPALEEIRQLTLDMEVLLRTIAKLARGSLP